MAQSQPPEKPPLTHAQRVNIIGGLASTHFGVIAPVVRFCQGSQAYNNALYTLLILLFYASYIPAVRLYIFVWIGLVIYSRFKASPTEYSRFEGFQWPLGKYLDDRIARIIEVPALLGTGLAVRLFWPNLGGMIASMALSSAILLAVRMEAIRAIKVQEADMRAEMAFRTRISKGGSW